MATSTRPTGRGSPRARQLARAETCEPRILFATFTVTRTDDAGPGSLRQAITDANAAEGADVIAFSIGTGRQTIRPLSRLPVIEGTAVIDGRTQPGWQGTPLIQLDGSDYVLGPSERSLGLWVWGQSSQILDLSFTRFDIGIALSSGGDHSVAGCYVGIDPAGVVGPNEEGIEIVTAGNDRIGFTPEFRDPNVISGNSIGVNVVYTRGTTLVGNFIGTDPTGAAAIPNGLGVAVGVSTGVRIGTPEAAAAGVRNVISGNPSGISVSEVDHVSIVGNYIGTDATGSRFLGGGGVEVRKSPDAVIGGAGPGQGNVIAITPPSIVEDPAAVMIDGELSPRAVVQGNRINTTADGLTRLGGGGSGISVRNAPDAQIGGAAPGQGNVILTASSQADCVRIQGADARNARVQGNRLNVTAADGDSDYYTTARTGVLVQGAVDTLVGGTAPGSGNVIGNCKAGIKVDFWSRWVENFSRYVTDVPERTHIEGNLIGTNAAGAAGLGNETGIVGGAKDMVIGGTAPGAGNVVSGNDTGLDVGGDIAVLGNFVGTNAAGTAAVPNRTAGITARGNVRIGGAAPGAGNVISGNGTPYSGTPGLVLTGAGALVLGNLIGTAADGVTPLGNSGDGITVSRFAETNFVGGTGPGEGNLIAYNGDGIRLQLGFVPSIPARNDTVILGNRIFSNAGMGIDAGEQGVTENDPGARPTRPQAFPVLTSAVWGGSPGETGTRVRGTLDSEKSTRFRVEIFASPAPDRSGYGEGARPVATVEFTTDASGHAEFDADAAAALTQDDWVTATATKLAPAAAPATGWAPVRTSEFSRAIRTAAAPQVVPRVHSVGVTGAGSSPAFGQAGVYVVPDGARQLDVLPFVEPRFAVRFNRDVEVQASDLVVRGVDRTYGATGFAYDPVLHVASWAFQPISGRVVLDLASGGADGVRAGGDPAQAPALDGDWANGNDSYPSGDGTAGGDLHFRLNLLPGDATGDTLVNALDVSYVKQRLNLSARNPGAGAVRYTSNGDLNADGRINALDLAAVRQYLNTRLSDPGPPPSPAATLSGRSSVTKDLFATGALL